MKLFFKKTGEGRPLIILHGLFGMSDNWMTLSKVYSTRGIACYTVDLRNHGRSPHSMDFSYEAMVADIAELMDDENISTADLIGHSLGGKVAMFFARDYQSRLRKLIVADMAPRYYPPHHQTILAALNSVDPSRYSSRKEIEEVLRVSIREETTVQFLLKNLFWNEKEKLDWRFGLKEIEANIEEVGKEFTSDHEIENKALFIRGERSGYITDDDVIEIKNIFPNSKIETIPGAGHWVHADKPEAFAESCMRFLSV